MSVLLFLLSWCILVFEILNSTLDLSLDTGSMNIRMVLIYFIYIVKYMYLFIWGYVTWFKKLIKTRLEFKLWDTWTSSLSSLGVLPSILANLLYLALIMQQSNQYVWLHIWLLFVTFIKWSFPFKIIIRQNTRFFFYPAGLPYQYQGLVMAPKLYVMG